MSGVWSKIRVDAVVAAGLLGVGGLVVHDCFVDGDVAVLGPVLGDVGGDCVEGAGALVAVVVDREGRYNGDAHGAGGCAGALAGGHQDVAILTMVAGAANPNPTRRVARMATLSDVK